MAKATKVNYVCQNCGATFSKWSGRCDNCGAWNSLLEQVAEDTGRSAVARSTGHKLKTTSLGSASDKPKAGRLPSGFGELDEVLGGGLMPGSVSLMAGQPGIGKSTLLLQVAAYVAQQTDTLYISGEESVEQVSLRAKRLGANKKSGLDLAGSTNADDIAATIRSGKYKLVIVDSIQTLSLGELTSAPGTVSQITNSSNVIIRAAKSTNAAVMLVGHVTKEGSIAGPKVLEHLVDVVLQFEGDRYGGFKIVRAAKNRYGSTNEAAIFDMQDEGLKPVKNPSAALLAERQNGDGSIILATIEGTRPILVEIQALVNTTNFGYPKRTASGFDLNRLNVLAAVLEKRTKLKLSDKDIYVNVVGGVRIQDPAADLAVCMAIASAAAGRRLGDDVVVFGEVGLGGEVRSVQHVARRVAEAKKLGFKMAIGPHTKPNQSFVHEAKNMRQALITYLEK